MNKEQYIQKIIELLEKCEKMSTLEFIYTLLRKTA